MRCLTVKIATDVLFNRDACIENNYFFLFVVRSASRLRIHINDSMTSNQSIHLDSEWNSIFIDIEFDIDRDIFKIIRYRSCDRYRGNTNTNEKTCSSSSQRFAIKTAKATTAMKASTTSTTTTKNDNNNNYYYHNNNSKRNNDKKCFFYNLESHLSFLKKIMINED